MKRNLFFLNFILILFSNQILVATLYYCPMSTNCTQIIAPIDKNHYCWASPNSNFYKESFNSRFLGFIGNNLSHSNFEGAYAITVFFNKMTLININFNDSILYGCFFTSSNVTNTKFINSDVRKADFRYADVQGANFTNANLENSRFHDIKNLETTIVTEANFKGVKGLTNKQKQFLRDNGALNVPADLIYDCNLENERTAPVVIDHEKIEKKRKSFLKRLFCIKRKKVNAEVQTER